MMEKKQLLELLESNRSYRRFDSSVQLSEEEIRSWIEALRYTASAKNAQPLKYRIVADKAQVDAVLHYSTGLHTCRIGKAPLQKNVRLLLLSRY